MVAINNSQCMRRYSAGFLSSLPIDLNMIYFSVRFSFILSWKQFEGNKGESERKVLINETRGRGTQWRKGPARNVT